MLFIGLTNNSIRWIRRFLDLLKEFLLYLCNFRPHYFFLLFSFDFLFVCSGILLYEFSAGYAPFRADDQMEIYKQIFAEAYKCPHDFSHELKDLIKNILKTDLTRRFGNLRAGVNDIKYHKWFKDTDWVGLYEKRLPAPLIPTIRSLDDTSQFEEYSEGALQAAELDEFTDIFADFWHPSTGIVSFSTGKFCLKYWSRIIERKMIVLGLVWLNDARRIWRLMPLASAWWLLMDPLSVCFFRLIHPVDNNSICIHFRRWFMVVDIVEIF